MTTPARHRLSTPRAAALAGVLFALLFATVLVLMRAAPTDGGDARARVAAILMPFAGIAFLWFIGVVRDGFGGFEDKFFSTVFIGSGLLFLAMMFAASATNMAAAHSEGSTAAFAHELMLAFAKTYGLRMAAVFMITLATIWLKTSLMPRWLVIVTYAAAVGLLVASDVTMWLVLAFPLWVLFVSLLLLTRRAGALATDTA